MNNSSETNQLNNLADTPQEVPEMTAQQQQLIERVSGRYRPELSPEHRASNIISLMRDIIRVLETENQALNRPNVHELSPLVQEKDALLTLYEEEADYLATHPEFVQKISSERRSELREMSVKVDQMIKDNLKTVERSLQVSHHLMGLIKNAATKAQGKSGTYHRLGKSSSGQKGQGTIAPVSLDRDL